MKLVSQLSTSICVAMLFGLVSSNPAKSQIGAATSTAANGGVAAHEVHSLSDEQVTEYELDRTFYKKSTLVHDILIISSKTVSDHAILETAYQFSKMMKSIAPSVAQRIRDRKVLCILIGHNELTSDLPQFKTDKTGKELDFYNWRQRGFLTNKSGRPTVVFAEEDVLEYEGGMQLESILIHEFGHVIHGAGFDEALQARLTDAFERARAKGIWKDGRAAQRFRRIKSEVPVSLFDELTGSFPEQPPALIKKCLERRDILVNGKPTNFRVKVTQQDRVLIVFGGPKECYAHKNRAEYWAEGVQCWYDTNRMMDHDHNHIHTRDGLRTYDPHLAKLCEEVLGDSKWRFVSPRKRAGKEHLRDFDPAQSPKVVDPEHIQNAAYDYFDKYWQDYWQRLYDKHALSRELKVEGATSLAKAAREKGNTVRGAILFPQQQLNCVKCHAVGEQQLLGPDLNRMSDDATDVYLVESLLEPSKAIKKGFELVKVITNSGKTYSGRIVEQSPAKLLLRDASESNHLIALAKQDIDEIAPGTNSSMPDGLMDQLSNRQQFLDLARYMMELADVGSSLATNQFNHSRGGDKLSEELRGLVLLDDFSCFKCHTDDSQVNRVSSKRAPNLAWASGRINPQYIERFIAAPAQVKPGTTMPDVLSRLDEDERAAAARAMTHYLLSGDFREFFHQAIDPIAADRGAEQFHSVGCVACHSPRNDDRSERFPETSVALGKLNEKYNVDGLAAFLKDPHAVRPSGRMPNLQLSHWEAVDISHYLLQGTTNTEKPLEPFKVDRDLAEKGKTYFQQLGCIQCHERDEIRGKRVYAALKPNRTAQGCLSDRSGNWPRYRLDESQRHAIAAALSRNSKTLTDQEQIAVTLTTFKCVACHQRGDLGGVTAERDEYFHTTNQNLGPQGRIPPTLTGVGAKLKPKWMREVLVSGRTVRPYLKTRMPQYGAENVEHLIPLLQQTDTLVEVEFASFEDQKQMRTTGHELAGSSGLNCVACHTYQQKRAETMSAVDLTEMAQRLQKNWFYHYMRVPQRFSQNTVMPTFWPGGRAMRKDILAGNADQQIEALWQYLLEGRQARMPRGLIREPIELLAAKEAVMLRRNYGGIGKRGIGVGYPNQVNLAFDAEQMRLAMIWKGKFADPGAAWRGQGSGTVRPLGGDLIQFPAGPEFDDVTSPWVVGDGRPPQHSFKGYYLDRLQRPTFMYRFHNVQVEDYPIDVRDEQSNKVFIRRTLTFVSEQGRMNVVFRVAADPNILDAGNGTFLIAKNLRIRIDNEHQGQIITTQTGKQVRIPLDIANGKTKLVLEYRW